MCEVNKVFSAGWFNCFASFADNGAPTELCREVLMGAGITKDEAYEFMESGDCTDKARTELEDYTSRLMRIECGDENEVGEF